MAGFLAGMDVEKLEIAVENGKKAFEAKQYVILVFLVSERANELDPLFLVYSIHKVTFGFRTGLNHFGMFQVGNVHHCRFHNRVGC